MRRSTDWCSWGSVLEQRARRRRPGGSEQISSTLLATGTQQRAFLVAGLAMPSAHGEPEPVAETDQGLHDPALALRARASSPVRSCGRSSPCRAGSCANGRGRIAGPGIVQRDADACGPEVPLAPCGHCPDRNERTPLGHVDFETGWEMPASPRMRRIRRRGDCPRAGWRTSIESAGVRGPGPRRGTAQAQHALAQRRDEADFVGTGQEPLDRGSRHARGRSSVGAALNEADYAARAKVEKVGR